MALVAATESEPAGADPGFSAGQLTAIAEVVQWTRPLPTVAVARATAPAEPPWVSWDG